MIKNNFETYIKTILENDYNESFEEELETVGISGEYWFDETGTTMYADGDVGDMNHEAHVIQQCAGSLASEFNVYLDEPYLETGSSLEREIIDTIIDELDIADETEKENMIEQIRNDPAQAIIEYLIENNNMSNEDASDLVLTAYGSMKDAREYAIKKWNWARVQGDSIECNKLDSITLKNIADGINNALSEEGLADEYAENPEVLEKHPYTISTYTGKRYEITLEDMEKGNVSGLEQADFEIKNSSATHQVRQMDVKDMPDYYQKKGVIGDSVEHDNYPEPEQWKKPKLPKGYKVKVKIVHKSDNGWAKTNWYDCEVWGPETVELFYKDKPSKTINVTKLFLSTSGTMFESKEKAYECGARRAWDMFNGKTEWS